MAYTRRLSKFVTVRTESGTRAKFRIKFPLAYSSAPTRNRAARAGRFEEDIVSVYTSISRPNSRKGRAVDDNATGPVRNSAGNFFSREKFNSSTHHRVIHRGRWRSTNVFRNHADARYRELPPGGSVPVRVRWSSLLAVSRFRARSRTYRDLYGYGSQAIETNRVPMKNNFKKKKIKLNVPEKIKTSFLAEE